MLPFCLWPFALSTSVSLATVAVEGFRRAKSRDGRVRFEGVGLDPIDPLHVAEAGNLGGGMSLCFGGWGPCSSLFCEGLRDWEACETWDAALDEARRQPPRLSFRLSDDPDEGVSGSVDVEVCAESDVSFFTSVRGPFTCPFTFMLCNSTSVSLSLYSPLGREYKRANSPLPFGNELDAKGVVICRPGFSVGIGIADAPRREESFRRRLKAELLLRRYLPVSYCSMLLLFEKKLAFDAVIGVLGVLLLARFGGGVVLRSSTSAEGTGNDEILLLNGVPSGSKFNGGSLIGWRFFLLVCGTAGDLSISPEPTVSPLLCLIVPLLFRGGSVLVGSSPKASIF